MSSNFSIQSRRSNGNLHLRPRGDLDGSSAWELIRLIHKKYDGTGRIFIDTHDLGRVYPFGCDIFKWRLTMGNIRPQSLFFKGKKGLGMAPNGSRVIVATRDARCRCDGNCRNCPCALKRDGKNTKHPKQPTKGGRYDHPAS